VLLLPVELCGVLEVGVYLTTKLELLLPNLLLLMIGADEVLRDTPLDDRLVRPLNGRPRWISPETTPGGSHNMTTRTSLAKRGARGNPPRSLELLQHCRLHLWRVRRRHLPHHRDGPIVPSSRGSRGRIFLALGPRGLQDRASSFLFVDGPL